jgi:hypothetical protein
MIFSLTKAIPLFTVLGRPNSGWLSNRHNSDKVVPAGQNHQRTPADSGMFGLLVSNDPARGSWF